ncbi:MAG: hypothetical protein ACI9IP_000732 [Arcticibacterium sp.]|jgi:hypothetical protein
MTEPPLKGEEDRDTVIISDAIRIFHTLKKRRGVYLLLLNHLNARQRKQSFIKIL